MSENKRRELVVNINDFNVRIVGPESKSWFHGVLERVRLLAIGCCAGAVIVIGLLRVLLSLA
jgi:hypothetical protein